MARECRMVAMQEEREQKVSLSTASLIEARDDALSATFAPIFLLLSGPSTSSSQSPATSADANDAAAGEEDDSSSCIHLLDDAYRRRWRRRKAARQRRIGQGRTTASDYCFFFIIDE